MQVSIARVLLEALNFTDNCLNPNGLFVSCENPTYLSSLLEVGFMGNNSW